MTRRYHELTGHPVVLALLAAVGPAGVIGLWYGIHDNPAAGIGAGLAVLCAAVVIATALSLPGSSREGLVLGVGLPLAGMMAWTHLSQPAYVWAVEIALGLLAAVWAARSWRLLVELPRLGSLWLAVPVWAVGILSAVGSRRPTVAGQRLVYLGFAVLVLLLVYRAVRGRHRDPGVGVAAGFLLCQAALMISGCRYLFVPPGGAHYASPSAWGYAQAGRFWGGPLLLYHPNFIAMIAVLTACRLGADPRLAGWQRGVVLGSTTLLLTATGSRTGLLMAGLASVVYLVLRVTRGGLPLVRPWRWFHPDQSRRVSLAALLPLVLCGVVLVASGGPGLLLTSRYRPGASGSSVGQALSGRPQVWAMVLHDFAVARPVEQVFGTADNSRGYLLRYPDRADPRYAGQPKLTADNGPLGALRRGGVAGLAFFVLGVVLVMRRTLRRGMPVWIPVTVLAALLTAVTEDEIAGTTPAWLMLAVVELAALYLAAPGSPGSAGAEPDRALPAATSSS